MTPVLAVGSVHVKCVIRAGMETVDLLLWRNKEKKVGEVQPVKFGDNSSCSRSQGALPCQMKAEIPTLVVLLSTDENFHSGKLKYGALKSELFWRNHH